MATVATHVQEPQPAKEARWSTLAFREMWASLAIAVIWLVVLFDALLDQDIVSSSAGASFTRIPSAIFVALFAFLATRVVAKHGLGEREREREDEHPEA